MKRLFSLLLAALVLLGAGPGVPAAQSQAPKPAAVFSLEQESGGDICWLTLSVKDAAFNVFQFALNFDPKEMVLVDEDGEQTEDFSRYQEDISGGWLSSIGCEASNTAGYFTFCGYIMPGQAAQGPLGSDGYVTADSKGVKLYRFRFRKLTALKKGIAVATDKTGLAYNEALPEGAGIACKEPLPELTVSFTYPAGETADRNETVDMSGQQGGGAAMTREERLKGTVAFQENVSVAVVEGVRTYIHPGENGIAPFLENGTFYAPLRFAAEALGAKVIWDGRGKSVALERGKTKIVVFTGYSGYTLDGKRLNASQKAVIRNSRTMVPVDLLESVFGVKHTVSAGLHFLAPASAPWDENNPAEQELTADISLLLSPLLGALAGTGP